MGPEVKELEGQLCEFTGANYYLPVLTVPDAPNSCFDGLGHRSERCRICAIIYVCCNCGGTRCERRATPFFVDVCGDTFNIDPAEF